MSKLVKAVIGAGYGDEGKGLFTDYLSSLVKKSIVVRFNGGAQAGHTVVTPEGKRHVFGHFTSNSFLENSKGYLSKFFMINPIIYLKELNQLNNLGIYPTIACHDDCYITTPYDMIINQWLENKRGNERHGSCGMGIGETVHRQEVEKFTLTIKDTYDINILKIKLNNIKSYFQKRIVELNIEQNLEKNLFLLEESFTNKFIEDIKEMKKTLKIGINYFNDDYFNDYDIVFEGAQGLMLDQFMGFFPHVTRSNTGLKNIIELLKENNLNNLEVVYATRCYKTRHGEGPLKNVLKDKPYENIIDETNIYNNYQGTIRFAYLDLNELKETIDKDIKSVNLNGINLNYKIGLSCLDQSEKIHYFKNEKILLSLNTNFGKVVSQYFNKDVIESFSATREKKLTLNLQT
jgi:adenylosuccinate synthase